MENIRIILKSLDWHNDNDDYSSIKHKTRDDLHSILV